MDVVTTLRLLVRAMCVLGVLMSPVHAQTSHLGSQERTARRLLARAEQDPRLELERVDHRESDSLVVQGYYTVPENRASQQGRSIRIGLIVLPATGEDPRPDPVFVLAGGPGAAATRSFPRLVQGWIRRTRDVVLIDQRGTGSSNRLQIRMPGSDDDLQGYFEPYFDPDVFAAGLARLQRRADLTQYTTANAVDDFDEIRSALGYEKINLRGGSYGTRAALVYMRRHAETIRTASLQGVQPIAYRNPLPHARGAQEALDLIFAEIRATPRYRAAFPGIEANFEATLARLRETPAQVIVRHPASGEPQQISFGHDAFAEAVRLQLYTLNSNRRLPLLLQRAHAGDYRELAQTMLRQNRSVRGALAWGLLMCVTASEDIWRIDESEIAEACAGTFAGQTRVRTQLAVAAMWPAGRVPATFAEPVRVDVPVLLLSGSHDPATTPRWGAEAARHLPQSLHVVVPGGHGVSGPEVEQLEKEFLKQGSVADLDVSGVEALTLPPLVMPPARKP